MDNSQKTAMLTAKPAVQPDMVKNTFDAKSYKNINTKNHW